MRRTEADEGGNEVHAMAVRHLACERVGLGGLADQPKPVSQPLDGGAGDEDRAFHRVGRLPADAVRGRRQQAVLRLDRRRPGVEQQEAARAVGGLRHAGFEAGLADERRLLVAGDAGYRDPGAEEIRLGRAEHTAAVADFRQQCARDAEEAQQLVIPVAAMDVEQQRARGIRHVGRMHLPTGQPPQQEAVDRAEGELAALRAFPRAGHVVEQPGELRAGEIGIEQQARALAYEGLGAVGLEPRAGLGRTTVLPDDGTVNRPAARAIPDDRRFALVGDADRGNVLRGKPGALQRLASGRDGVAPDVFRVVLHPAVGRVVLRQFVPGKRDAAALLIEDDAARRGRALVDGEDVAGAGHGRARWSSRRLRSSGVACSPVLECSQ